MTELKDPIPIPGRWAHNCKILTAPFFLAFLGIYSRLRLFNNWFKHQRSSSCLFCFRKKHFATLQFLKTFEMEVSTSLSVPTDQFLICLVLPECLLARKSSFSNSLRVAKHDDSHYTGLACSLFPFFQAFWDFKTPQKAQRKGKQIFFISWLACCHI